MKEFKVNKFLGLRLEKGKTAIYVDNKSFDQCKYLLLQVPRERLIITEVRKNYSS
ncbi:MAG: hypothetical protein KGD70_03815 [Candidatus Lokiarchaeota archaeon]|nr:hypothetical protein [Candidatus Lokiarchaeota archaeon]